VRRGARGTPPWARRKSERQRAGSRPPHERHVHPLCDVRRLPVPAGRQERRRDVRDRPRARDRERAARDRRAGAAPRRRPEAAPRAVPRRALDWIAARSVEWLVMTEDLPAVENRVLVDGAGRITTARVARGERAHRRLLERAKSLFRAVGYDTVLTQHFDIAM